MTTLNITVLINLLGWTIGLTLYALLLTMSLRSLEASRSNVRHERGLFRRLREHGAARLDAVSGFDALPLLTALLGLMWNAGALLTHRLYEFSDGQGEPPALALLGAASVSALGFLPAAVVHSAIRNTGAEQERSAGGKGLVVAAYTLSTLAAVMHFRRALTAGGSSSDAALYLLTGGFLLLMCGLLVLTHGETGWRRAVWATALSVFAVSALHLSGGAAHGAGGRWYWELVGHHASLPLALAILYRDYRFAFADIFLKRALALLGLIAVVALALAGYALVFVPEWNGDARVPVSQFVNPRSIGALFALCAGVALVFPYLRRAAARFVDAVVLRRADYEQLRAEIVRIGLVHETPGGLLDDVARRLQPALTAEDVSWRERSRETDEEAETNEPLSASTDLRLSESSTTALSNLSASSQSARHHRRSIARVIVPTAEAPRYELRIGELAGGRRLLSDDVEMLESVALTLARRIDSLRVTHERCEQQQREQEISKLATEAQLRALRAQVNPHFLFNALTTIGYLIQTSPERALSTLMRLTDLLRRVLRASGEWVTLAEELRLVEAYLDIERARFEERLRVRFDVPEELTELLIPSLVVQPIVENAIKHGIAPHKAGGEVRLTVRLVGNEVTGDEANSSVDENNEMALSLVIEDTGAGANAAQLARGRASGIGLANVEQRLHLCCGEAGWLTIESEAGRGARVELRLPVRLPPRKSHSPLLRLPSGVVQSGARLTVTSNDTDGSAAVLAAAATKAEGRRPR